MTSTTGVDYVHALATQQAQLQGQFLALEKSLKHWTIVEAEYEGLKEELLRLPEGSTTDEMKAMMDDFGGDAVTPKDVTTFLGLDKATAHSRDQVVGIVDRRIDYVQKSVRSLQKQSAALLEKIEKVRMIAEPALTDEHGQPLSEIREELDDDGNVISSSVSNTKQAAEEVRKVLEKVDLIDTDKAKPMEKKEEKIEEVEIEEHASSSDGEDQAESIPPTPATEQTETDEDAPNVTLPSLDEVRKNATSGPSIAELQQRDKSIPSVPQYPDETAEERAMREQMIRYSLTEIGPVVAQMDLEEGLVSDGDDREWNHTDNDDFDDDVEAGDSDGELDDSVFDHLYGFDDDDEESDSENEYGMSTRRQITDEYHQQMAELEARLNATLVGNAGPNPDLSKLTISGRDDPDFGSDIPAAGTNISAAVDNHSSKLSAESDPAIERVIESPAIVEQGRKAKTGPKRRVKFATELDVAPSTTLSSAPSSASTTGMTGMGTKKSGSGGSRPVPDILGETILERKAPVSKGIKSIVPGRSVGLQGPTTTEPKRSMFAARRGGAEVDPPATATTPETATPTADSILERRPDVANVAPPSIPDDLEPGILRREVVTEYYRHRNRAIQQHGGFTKPDYDTGTGGDEEEEEAVEQGPLMEVDEEGKTRKVSRFRAARIRQGL